MTISDDLEKLRASWGDGVPRDAASQIVRVLTARMDARPVLKRLPTPNEGDWCELCGLPRDAHRPSLGCVGEFKRTPAREREPGEEG